MHPQATHSCARSQPDRPEAPESTGRSGGEIEIDDTARLKFILEHELRVTRCENGWRACRYIAGRRLKWLGSISANPRAAIDSAIREARHGRP